MNHDSTSPSTPNAGSGLSPDRLHSEICAAIAGVAPDVAGELADLDPDLDLFEEFGLDSMDRLNIMTALAQATGVEIPDDRYPHLRSMNAISAHLA